MRSERFVLFDLQNIQTSRQLHQYTVEYGMEKLKVSLADKLTLVLEHSGV